MQTPGGKDARDLPAPVEETTSRIVDIGAARSAATLRSAGMRYRPPRMAQAPVSRPRLLRRLDNGTGVVWMLTGPPGSSKTTTLADYFRHLQERRAQPYWLSLFSEDNDPETLRRHLERAFPFALSDEDDAGPAQAMRGFIDGLECLSNPAARELLERFVLNLPPNSSFYLSARTLRGGSLYDGRLRGLVHVIDYDELKFTADEATALLGEGWSPWDCQRLNLAVDGWAAGLHFLGRAPKASRSLLKDASGHAAIPTEMAHYLDDVICARLDEGTLSALMDVSVLDRFTPEALAAVPGGRCDWSLIDAHIREGLFIRFIDDDRHWAALHPAFGRHLRHRLRRFHPGRYEEIKRFAASWFENHGFGTEAVRHAATMDDRALAERIMENAGPLEVELSAGLNVAWGAPVPVERSGDLPFLFLGQLYFRIRHGRLIEARGAFEQMRARTHDFTLIEGRTDTESIQAFARMIEMVLDASEDQPVTEQRLAALEQQLELCRGRQPILVAGIASLLSLAYLELSRYTEASTVCAIGMDALRDFKDSRASVFLRIHQADIALARDTIDKAALYIDDAQRVARIEGAGDSYEVLATQILRSSLHYETNELAAASLLLEPALVQLDNINGWLRLYVAGFGTAAAIAGITHGLGAAEVYLQRAEALARQRGLPRLLNYMAIARLREQTRAGEWRLAMETIDSPPLADLLASESLSPYALGVQIPGLLEAARLTIELGRPREAQGWLDRINKAFLDESDCRLRFTFRVIAMRAAYDMRRYNAAVDHMQSALDIAEHGGLARRALNNGAHLIEVFDWSVRNGRHLPARISAYVDGALRQADGTESATTLLRRSPRRGAEQVAHNFTLSPRETEIIALVAEGYITKEIATRLGISEGTVKSHRKKIHDKLGVASRGQAIARARDLLII